MTQRRRGRGEFWTEGGLGEAIWGVEENRSETKRRDTECAEKKKRIPHFARNDNFVELRRERVYEYRESEKGGASPAPTGADRKIYGGKLKDLSLVSTQTLTTLVFWAFSGSLLAVGMGLKGLMATRISTLVVVPLGDLVLRML